MKRYLSMAAVVALTITACGTAEGDTAATVGDSVITVADVRGVPNSVEGTMPVEEFAQYLSALIQWRIIENAAAAEFDIQPSEAEVSEELEEIISQISPGMSVEQVAEEQNLSRDTLLNFARSALIQDRIAAELGQEGAAATDEEVAAALVDERANLTEVCARHLLVETEEEAQAARDRIVEGEDFGIVAAEVSTDPGVFENEGDLGCSPAGRYVPEFRDASVEAEIDAITEPVQSEFGFHVIQVYERTEVDEADLPTEEEVRLGLTQMSGTQALEEWLSRQVDEATVTVEERFGTWTTDPMPQVIPPQT